MFMFHLVYALELIAMSMGVFLLSWALREKGRGVNLAKVFGYIVTVVSVILFLCSLWSNFTLWRVHQQMVKSIQLQQNMRPQIMQQLQQRMQQRSPDSKPIILHKPQSNAAPQKAPARKSEGAAQKAKEAPKAAAPKPATVSVNDGDPENSSSN